MELPKDFQEAIEKQFGDVESQKFVDSLKNEPAVSIRINTSKPSNIRGESIPWVETGFYLKDRPVFTLDPSFHAGAYYVQESSSMFLEWIWNNKIEKTEFPKVLDLCAAPGGKSTHVAELLKGSGFLISNEVIKSRATILLENVRKWGYINHWVTSNDPEDFIRLEGLFDVTFVDAPCSGEGLFRKDSKAMDLWSLENVNLCSSRQKRILANAIQCTSPNGYVVYSTCTFNQEEDEAVVDWMMEEFDMELIDLSQAGEEFKEVYVAKNGLKFLPHLTRGEGFFVALLRKRGGAFYTLDSKKKKSKNKRLKEYPVSWLNDNLIAVEDGSEVFIHEKETISWIENLEKKLSFLKKGVQMGEVFKNKLKPHHEFALWNQLSKSNYTSVSVNKKDALLYLKKEPISNVIAQKGYVLVEYEGNVLGWLHALGNRDNNMYPKEYRIRMNIPKDF